MIKKWNPITQATVAISNINRCFVVYLNATVFSTTAHEKLA